MKPLAVYKLSKVEAAVLRLDGALCRLEKASMQVNPSSTSFETDVSAEEMVRNSVAGMSSSVDAAEIAQLRKKCTDLTESLRAASLGVDVTVSRLKLLLED